MEAYPILEHRSPWEPLTVAKAVETQLSRLLQWAVVKEGQQLVERKSFLHSSQRSLLSSSSSPFG